MNTLVNLWQDAESKEPGKTALVSAVERLTYAEADARVRGLAAALAGRWGVGKGDVVALLAPNCPEFVITYFAVTRLGAIVQPVDERLSPDETRTVLVDSGTRTLVLHAALAPKFEKVRAGVPAITRVLAAGGRIEGAEDFAGWAASGGESEGEADAGVLPGDPAELMYTSGTVGEPKAVVRTHANVRAASRNSLRGFGYRGDDVIGITMPMSHSSALNSQMAPLIELGGRLVLMERFDAAALLDTIRSEQITCMRAVPAMLRQLLALPAFRAEQLPSLRLIVNSSAPIDPQLYTQLKGRFAGIEVMNSYGLTEASTCTVLPDAMALARPDSVGVPIIGVEMRVADEEGRTVADGEEGEICIRGEHVFAGYRGRPEATAAAFRDGWLLTGDLGHRDAEGYYYLHGRMDDVINCGGRKVVPEDVERCILQMPEVKEAAVAGYPHRILGQVAKAFVVEREPGGLDPKDVIRHCARQLASYQVPFHVEVVQELPRNSLGKVLRRKLAASASPEAGAEKR